MPGKQWSPAQVKAAEWYWQIPCPKCGAKIGAACNTPTIWPHSKRAKAAGRMPAELKEPLHA